MLELHFCFFSPLLPQCFWFSAKLLDDSRNLSPVARAPPYITAAVSPRPCYSHWAAVLGRRSSKSQWGIPIPKMGCTFSRKVDTPGAPRCNCMCLLYFFFLGWGISEVCKEKRTFHCLSKLRNNWSHNKWEKIEEEIEKKVFFFKLRT